MPDLQRDRTREEMRPPPNVSREQIEEAIYQWIIGKNSERDRQIMYESVFRGFTYEKIAELHDMSDRQIANIVRKNWQLILKHMPG